MKYDFMFAKLEQIQHDLIEESKCSFSQIHLLTQSKHVASSGEF